MSALLSSLVLMALAIAPTGLPIDDAEHTLQAAGLKRVGGSYVLPQEADVIKLEKALAELQSHLDNLSQQYERFEEQAATEKQAAASDRARANAFNGRTRGQIDASARSHDSKAKQHQDQANRIKQEASQPDQDFKKKQKEYNDKAQHLLEQYANIAVKVEVFDALRAINRTAKPKCVLGPANAYRPNLIKLMTDTLAKNGYTLEGSHFILTEDPKLLTDLNKTLTLGREVAMFDRRLASAETKTATAGTETKLSPEQVAAKRAELDEQTNSLRHRIKETQSHREAAIADGEAQICVDELNQLKVSKKKLELGMKNGLKTAIEQFEKFDQGQDSK